MEKKSCFVIAPIGDPDSETRKRSDQVLKHVITPPVHDCGYEPTRADQISEPGMITSQVIQRIVDDDLVVADLTERNPNVFYELANRHAIRKPLVQLIKKGEQIPFDVAGTRTVHVDHHDLDSVEEAKKEIASQILALEGDSSQLESPISVSLDLQILRQSDNPEQRSLADVLSAISELRSSVISIDKQLDHSDSQESNRILREIIERYEGQFDHSRQINMEFISILQELIADFEQDMPQNHQARVKQEEKILKLRRIRSDIRRYVV